MIGIWVGICVGDIAAEIEGGFFFNIGLATSSIDWRWK